MTLFLLLVYWFLSIQKEYYLQADLIRFDIKENLLLFVVISLISLLYFYKFNVDEKDSFIRIAKTFSYTVFFSLYFFFLIQKTLIAAGLFINRSFSKETIKEKFEITSINIHGEIEIRSLKEGVLERIENKFTKEDKMKIKKGNVINIIFEKGILGKKYLKNKTIVIKDF